MLSPLYRERVPPLSVQYMETNVIKSWLEHVGFTTTNEYIEIDLARKREAIERCPSPVAKPKEDIPCASGGTEWARCLTAKSTPVAAEKGGGGDGGRGCDFMDKCITHRANSSSWEARWIAVGNGGTRSERSWRRARSSSSPWMRTMVRLSSRGLSERRVRRSLPLILDGTWGFSSSRWQGVLGMS